MSFSKSERKALKMGLISYLGLVLSISVIITALCGVSIRAQNFTELRIPQGVLQGKVLRSREGKTFNGFMGIPFAHPPERFEPAKFPPPTWEGIYNATDYGDKCLQINVTTFEVEGTEDCLFINVFTPNTTGNLSVLAFIHGGGFWFGRAFENGPEFFMDHDVVFVTFSYRLAALGYLSTEDEVLPGNLGMKDQNLALRWIQENINFFGGNKDKVTLFGESAGAGSVSHHIVSPLSRGLFRQAICQSGSSLSRWAVVDKPKTIFEELAFKLNCSTGSSKGMVDCLREKPGKDIIEVTLQYNPLGSPVVFGPVIEPNSTESAFLTEHPLILYEEGRFAKVPMILTVNDIEGIGLSALDIINSPEKTDLFNNNWTESAATAFLVDKDYYSNESIHYATQQIRDFYFGSKLVGNETLLNLTDAFSDSAFIQRSRVTAQLHSSYAPVYMSLLAFKGQWSQTFRMGFEKVLGMAHADDLQYLFTDHGYPPFPVGSESEGFSKTLVQLWVNFANTGDPNYELRGEKWLPLETGQRDDINWLVLKNEPEFIVEPLLNRTLLWDHLDQILESGVLPQGT